MGWDKATLTGLPGRCLAMAKRQPKVTASVSILIAVVTLGLVAVPFLAPQRSDAQSPPGDTASALDDVDECDLLAAHPSDSERVAEGVADDAIVPRLAIKACEAAVKRSPNEARFIFQLGRALLAGKRRQEAVQKFEQVAQRDYAAGLAYLGDAYQFGYGVKADAQKALEAYRKAVERGFEPAQGQIEMLTFQPEKYLTDIPALLFRGEVASLTDATRQPMNVYLYGFVTTLAQECHSLLPPIAMRQVLVRRYPSGWTPEADVTVDVMRTGPAGEFDAKAFVQRHGCDGPIAKEMGERLATLLAQRQ